MEGGLVDKDLGTCYYGPMSKPDLSIFRVPKGCVIQSLPFSPEQKEIFDDVVDEDPEEYPNFQIFRIVTKEWGINLKRTAFNVHRRKECLCYQPKEA